MDVLLLPEGNLIMQPICDRCRLCGRLATHALGTRGSDGRRMLLPLCGSCLPAAHRAEVQAGSPDCSVVVLAPAGS